MEQVIAAVDNMYMNLSGNANARWFDGVEVLHLNEHEGGYLRDKLKRIHDWALSMLCIPAGASMVLEDVVFKDYLQLVLAWNKVASMFISTVQNRHIDVMNNPVASECLRKIRFSFEIISHIRVLWVALKDIHELQVGGGNLFHIPISDHAFKNVSVCTLQQLREIRKLGGEEVAQADEECNQDVTYWVIEYIMRYLENKRYRKLGDIVYQEKIVTWKESRYGTSYWTPVLCGENEDQRLTIASCVWGICSRDNDTSAWYNLVTARSNKVIDVITNCVDARFPTLDVRRNVFSFANGIYDTQVGLYGEFFSYGAESSQYGMIASCRFFDSVFREEYLRDEDVLRWIDIETPLFDSVLKYQEQGCPCAEAEPDYTADADRAMQTFQQAFHRVLQGVRNDHSPEEFVKRVDAIYDQLRGKLVDHASNITEQAPSDTQGNRVGLTRGARIMAYCFLGRLLHSLGTFDDWQIVPFFKGVGGSGKSTIGQVAKNFFAPQHVGLLSNNSETKFGLQGLYDKYVWICLEIKSSVSLDQADFQSMVSGEEISVAIKNKTAQQVRWTAPGLICGNDAPGWVDAQGSIARRLAVFNFPFVVKEEHGVPDLLTRILKEEIGSLVVKCNIAYRSLCHRYHNTDIWSFLPPYFKEERLKYQKLSDPVFAAIYDYNKFRLKIHYPHVEDEWRTQLSDIEMHYRAKWRDIMHTSFPVAFTNDKYTLAFDSAKLRVEQGLNDHGQPCTWVIGIQTTDSA